VKYSRLLLSILFIHVCGTAQIKRDPVMVALGGAYTTQADGIYAVGVNPANLTYQHGKPFMWQIGTINLGVVNNFFSLENTMGLSGKNLEAESQRGKYEIYDQVRDGLRFSQDLHLALPALNYASGNMAITNDLVTINDIKMPFGIFKFILDGNEINEALDLEYSREQMGLLEHAFSFAVPTEKFSWGVSLKFLQGLYYMGTDPDSSYTFLTTDTTAFHLNARYFMRHGIGGYGTAVDVGFASKEINGWRVGLSLINAVGSIEWNQPSALTDLLGVSDETGYFKWGGQEVPRGYAMVHEITADSVTIDKLSKSEWKDLFKERKAVVKDLDSDGNPRQFKVRYPGLLRMGVSKQIDPDIQIAGDLVAGFSNRLGVHQRWKISAGLQFTRFKSIPMRIGYMYGGKYLKELGFGAGLHAGPIIYDFAFSFRNGIWFHNMKGASISFGIALTSLKSRKDKSVPSQ
tara:strand:+ start:10844 stop:12226 length:1383 start_codon:yes stop_codon:yes gene_type:complete